MAIVSVSPGFFDLDVDAIDWSTFTSISATSSTGFQFNFSDGSYWLFTGNDLLFGGPNGLPTSGTLTGFTTFDTEDNAAASVVDMSMSAAGFSAFVQASDEAGFIEELLDQSDTITGGNLADNLVGAGSADTISGEGGDDRIDGGASDDLIDGGDGTDIIEGGSDSDVLYGDANADVLIGDVFGTSTGDPGSDTVYGGIGHDLLVDGIGDDSAFGGDGADVADGGDGFDLFDGGSGNDLAFGSNDNDSLIGGTGADAFFGGEGDDYLDGGNDDDWLSGDDPSSANNGRDSIYGGAGNDVIMGGGDEDSAFGGTGDDYIETENDNDSIEGGDGSDRMFGGNGADSILGFSGDDVGSGDSGDDEVDGNEGNDWLDGGGGNDTVRGGEDADTLLGHLGDDTVFGGAGTDLIIGGGGNDSLIGSDGDDHVTGDAGNDVIVLESGADIGIGSDGNDTIAGDAGADTQHGDAGNDSLSGDADADLLFGADGNDRIDGGTAQDTLFGGDGRDTAFGSEGVDTIYGGAGDDTSFGGEGNDTFIGGSGTDIVIYDDFVATIGSFENTLTIDAGDQGIDVLVDVEVVDGSPPADTIDLGSLAPGDGFIVAGAFAGDYAGYRVAGAGDVNGDGFADFVIGAVGADEGGQYSGSSFVVFGSAGSLGTLDIAGRQVLDLASLGSAQGFVIQGDAAGDYLGQVASAGDVNGDGFADIVIGAPAGDDGGDDAGEAYVIFGSAGGFGTVDGSGRSVIDLSVLGTAQGFVIQGDGTYDYAGSAVASAGDLNGDGFDDLLIGARDGNDGGSLAGQTYVVFGTAGAFGTVDGSGRRVIDLASLETSAGFVIQGDTSGDRLGSSVSAAGDVNGDGLDDILVTAPSSDSGGASAGDAYVIFGTEGPLGTVDGTGRRIVDMSSLPTDAGFVLRGATEDRAGLSVAGAGDVNGDGFDDLMIGAAGETSFDQGKVYIVLGSAAGFGSVDGTGRRILDLASLSADQGFVLLGASVDERAGWAISSAGDINGDGFADLLVGAYLSDAQGNNSGKAYVIFGSDDGFGTIDSAGRAAIDLGNLNPLMGIVIAADTGEDHLGVSVSAAGDINGDGFDDLLVGAETGDDGGTNAGETYVLFGAPGGSDTAVTLAGSAGADELVGSSLADTLVGNGGLDVFRGGSGNDLFIVPSPLFADIDGGRGIDTLRLAGTGSHLDLTAIQHAEIESIERIDIDGSGDNMLTLDRVSALGLTEVRGEGLPAIRVDGSAGDTVNLDGQWIDVGNTTVGGTTYDRWQFDADAGGPLGPDTHFELWIDQEIDVLFLS